MGDKLEVPRALLTNEFHPRERTVCAVARANLPRVFSASDISVCLRLCVWSGGSTLILAQGVGLVCVKAAGSLLAFARVGQGGARRSQGVSAGAQADDSADTPWPPRQVLPAGGAARWSRQNVRSRVRSPSEAKGTWEARRPQLGKHAPRSHHATQNSRFWSLVGGRPSFRSGRNPLGRTTMVRKSGSDWGFSMRATTCRVLSVKPDTAIGRDGPWAWIDGSRHSRTAARACAVARTRT